jgi:hypothetical protein
MNISYGKIERETGELKVIQELIGVRQRNNFGASSEEDLDLKMSEMALVDLQKLAISVGVPGGGNRNILKRKIKDAYVKYIKGSSGMQISSSSKMELNGKNKAKRELIVADLMRV